MTGKIVYTEGEIDEVRLIADFLPPPAALAFREETVKVTIALSRQSVDFSSARPPSTACRTRR